MDRDNIQLTQEVIDAVNGELAYQNKMSGTSRADAVDNGLSGQLLTLRRYVNKALDSWVDSVGDGCGGHIQAQENLRKVMAICARALVRYGCPKREAPDVCP